MDQRDPEPSGVGGGPDQKDQLGGVLWTQKKRGSTIRDQPPKERKETKKRRQGFGRGKRGKKIVRFRRSDSRNAAGGLSSEKDYQIAGGVKTVRIWGEGKKKTV